MVTAIGSANQRGLRSSAATRSAAAPTSVRWPVRSRKVTQSRAR